MGMRVSGPVEMMRRPATPKFEATLWLAIKINFEHQILTDWSDDCLASRHWHEEKLVHYFFAVWSRFDSRPLDKFFGQFFWTSILCQRADCVSSFLEAAGEASIY